LQVLYLGQMSDSGEANRPLFEAVNAIMVRHDPAGLIAIGTPIDEYKGEVAKILERVWDAPDVGELRSIVYQVFQDSFGEDTCGPEEKYEPIAQQIWDVCQTSDAADFPSESPDIDESSVGVCSQKANDQPLPQEITRLLNEWGAGSEAALGEVYSQVYADLHRLAQRKMWRERGGHTLQADDLVSEVYSRLLKQHPDDFPNRRYFLGVASRMMDRILIDYARRYRRGGKRFPPGDRLISFTKAVAGKHNLDEQKVADALKAMAKHDPTMCKIFELKTEGFSQEEIAETVGLTVRNVAKEIKTATAWLSVQLNKRV
jgi:RNA polymerase sigma factor (TIGR02999 family)